MIKNVLFDLDGTLLNMPDLGLFLKKYFSLFTSVACKLGYDKELVVKALKRGTEYVYANDGTRTNKEAMWIGFEELLGPGVYESEPVFDEFYRNEFRDTVTETRPDPATACMLVKCARRHAEKVILATNPFFPLEAVRTRLSWLNLKDSDFDGITSYENSRYCKPKPEYYSQTLELFGLSASESLMVGNDVSEDILPARKIGLDTFLLHGCVINRSAAEYESAEGDADALCRYIEQQTL